ncbi:MAG: hypothetical protein MI747_10785 [Desulfobacterales bacterium]|nr:hypothetical protein [Desulfobacterales bacterium]
MPTLEERGTETQEELNLRLENRTIEMGITFTFARYLEQMETYLLQLEQRVKELEARHEIHVESEDDEAASP